MAGTLYIVSTPIGNLEDITLRALRVLGEVDCICAEDTRTTRKLLAHYHIRNRLVSCHANNIKQRIPQIISRLQQGERVALVSEAGTPGISDPGHALVMAAVREGIAVVPIPGPSAVIAALVASGLPTNRFVFEGFLPRKKGRQTKLLQLKDEPGTIVLYESPQRVRKTIEDIVNIFGNRYIVLARELTKRFEEFIRGYASDILQLLDEGEMKGEIVLLIAGTQFKPFT